MGWSSSNDKLLFVQAPHKRGHVVAVTGDGTNDAPGLHEVKIVISQINKYVYVYARVRARVINLQSNNLY